MFLAESIDGKQKVAIKAIPKSNTSISAFINEIRILSSLDHPNIVKYFGHYQSDNYLYVVMEYCEGEELFQKLSRKGKMTEKETKDGKKT